MTWNEINQKLCSGCCLLVLDTARYFENFNYTFTQNERVHLSIFGAFTHTQNLKCLHYKMNLCERELFTMSFTQKIKTNSNAARSLFFFLLFSSFISVLFAANSSFQWSIQNWLIDLLFELKQNVGNINNKWIKAECMCVRL